MTNPRLCSGHAGRAGSRPRTRCFGFRPPVYCGAEYAQPRTCGRDAAFPAANPRSKERINGEVSLLRRRRKDEGRKLRRPWYGNVRNLQWLRKIDRTRGGAGLSALWGGRQNDLSRLRRVGNDDVQGVRGLRRRIGRASAGRVSTLRGERDASGYARRSTIAASPASGPILPPSRLPSPSSRPIRRHAARPANGERGSQACGHPASEAGIPRCEVNCDARERRVAPLSRRLH